MHRLDAPRLAGRHVVLEQLRADHVPGLLAAASRDRSTYGWTAVPDSEESMRRYVDAVLAEQEQGAAVPFVQRRAGDGAIVGTTRFFELEWWPDRPLPVEAEVGGTWLSPEVQRTAHNTEAKYMMFRYAFEDWGAHRVCLCTDSNNARSRAAIQRVGARFEGILRNHRVSYEGGSPRPYPRDTAIFAITSDDWPEVRRMLESRLA